MFAYIFSMNLQYSTLITKDFEHFMFSTLMIELSLKFAGISKYVGEHDLPLHQSFQYVHCSGNWHPDFWTTSLER